MNIRLLNCEFQYPAALEPKWSKGVERWYQLDAYAYGLAELYTENKENLAAPELIVLASEGASNETDFQFVKSGASSPSKFVHTLPSVRGAPLMELMGWSGEIICVQNDPQTWIDGLVEALDLIKQDSGTFWILQVSPINEGSYRATLAELSYDATSEKKVSTPAQTLLIASKNTVENRDTSFKAKDSEFWKWLENNSHQKLDNPFFISSEWKLNKA